MLQEVQVCVAQLDADNTILYPTDTIWGLGCDAHSQKAFERIYNIKQRPANKSVIALVNDKEMLKRYAIVDFNNPKLMSLLNSNTPTTIIYQPTAECPKHLISESGEVAIRIVQDDFCKVVIENFGRAITSTSANPSGHPSPANFSEIHTSILNEVDYVVNWRQHEMQNPSPSRIMRFNDGMLEQLR